MLDEFKKLTARQYETAIRTLTSCIVGCPEANWNAFVARCPFSQAELHACNMRHIQHHAAQLTLRLRLDGMEQVLWPNHCIQELRGAALHSDFEIGSVQRVFQKGTDRRIDSYSGFFDNRHRQMTRPLGVSKTDERAQ